MTFTGYSPGSGWQGRGEPGRFVADEAAIEGSIIAREAMWQETLANRRTQDAFFHEMYLLKCVPKASDDLEEFKKTATFIATSMRDRNRY